MKTLLTLLLWTLLPISEDAGEQLYRGIVTVDTVGWEVKDFPVGTAPAMWIGRTDNEDYREWRVKNFNPVLGYDTTYEAVPLLFLDTAWHADGICLKEDSLFVSPDYWRRQRDSIMSLSTLFPDESFYPGAIWWHPDPLLMDIANGVTIKPIYRTEEERRHIELHNKW